MKRELPPRKSDGKLPAYSWPGLYPLYYITEDLGHLCAACANGANGSDADVNSTDPQWKIIDSDVNFEQEDTCAHCNKPIEMAYV